MMQAMSPRLLSALAGLALFLSPFAPALVVDAHIDARNVDAARFVPVRWTGPSLNPDSPKVATETIEIAHHGFVVA